MHNVELPPNACASDVVGSIFENVAASESAGTSRTTRPLSSMKMRLRARGVLILSELISPRLELLTAEPGPSDRDERTNKALLSLRISGSADCWRPPFGLELDIYRIGEDTTNY
jgi:hypothetical protein